MYEAIRGAISGLDPKGPHELALEMSRMMLPSGFLFLRGLPNLCLSVSWFEYKECKSDEEHTSLKGSSCSRCSCYHSVGRWV